MHIGDTHPNHGTGLQKNCVVLIDFCLGVTESGYFVVASESTKALLHHFLFTLQKYTTSIYILFHIKVIEIT